MFLAYLVTPAKAGANHPHLHPKTDGQEMGPRLRGDDGSGRGK